MLCNVPKKWYQGWTEDVKIRWNASSGGVATAIAEKVIGEGGKVFACIFWQGRFVFEMASKKEELKWFQGSKYVKSDPMGLYQKILEQIQNEKNKNVLVIGLPCQIAGVKRVIAEKYQKKLLTIDLICHGTPAPAMLENFLRQYSIRMEDVKDIRFRGKGNKKPDYLAGAEEIKIVPAGVGDCYTRLFMEGVTYTENCYKCPYAKRERVSDVTVGDSWGSQLKSEAGNGISLILCNTEQGIKMVERAGLTLREVDIENAIAHNGQLNKPVEYSKKRDLFMAAIKKGMPFNRAVARCFPKIYIKYALKRIYIKMPFDPFHKNPKLGGENHLVRHPNMGISFQIQIWK